MLALAAVSVLLAPVPSAVADPVPGNTTVVSVTVVTQPAPVEGGFADLVVRLQLTDPEGLSDVVRGGRAAVRGREPVFTAEMTRDDFPVARPWATLADTNLARRVAIMTATRVSGTSTSGVWEARARLSSAFIGTWTGYPRSVADVNDDAAPRGYLIGARATSFTIGSPEQRPWKVVSAPVRVVTGEELWTPQMTVVDRVTGRPVPGAFLDFAHGRREDDIRPAVRTDVPAIRADASGSWTGTPEKLTRTDRVVEVWAGRGSRGLSLETVGCFSPTVKWQANQRVSTSGRVVTTSGNVWPAPSVLRVGDGIRMEYLVGRTWRHAAVGTVRSNGRYTMTWTPPAAGTYSVRVVKPGSVSICSATAGTTLPGVAVTVR